MLPDSLGARSSTDIERLELCMDSSMCNSRRSFTIVVRGFAWAVREVATVANQHELWPVTFVLTQGVREYRATIPHCVRRDDTVLEVGVAWGTTTAILARCAQKVVGIDPGQSLATAIRTHPQIQFEPIDGFDISSILKLGIEFTKVYIDISGCRPIADVAKMAMAHAAALHPQMIVIKSTALKRFVRHCVVWPGA